MVKGSCIVTAVAQVATVVQVRVPALELLHAIGRAKKKRKKKKGKMVNFMLYIFHHNFFKE